MVEAGHRKYYLAGPITNDPDHDKHFAAYQGDLMNLCPGIEFLNPTKLAPISGGSWGDYLRRDLPYMLECDGVILLPGWLRSDGAICEAGVACLVGRPVFYSVIREATKHRRCKVVGAERAGLVFVLEAFSELVNRRMGVVGEVPPAAKIPQLVVTGTSSRESILVEAARITSGARLSSYGHPRVQFRRLAGLWTALLRDKLRDGVNVEIADVPLILLALKLSRLVQKPDRDGWVDVAGYARTGAVVTGHETLSGGDGETCD